MSRINQALTAGFVCLAVSGCAMVGSKEPMFPPAMAVDAPSLAGVYDSGGGDANSVMVVRKADGAGYDAAFYVKRPDVAYRQAAALAFEAIPLGGGDHVLQVSCFAERDDKGWKKSSTPGYLYAVLMAARPAHDYWLGSLLPNGEGSRLSAKYHQQKDKDDGLMLTGLEPERAKSLFRDWMSAALKAGADDVTPYRLLSRWDAPTDSPEYDHPTICRDIPPNR